MRVLGVLRVITTPYISGTLVFVVSVLPVLSLLLSCIARHRKVSGLSFVSREHHHLYNRQAWRKLRARQLLAEPLCRMHMQIGQVVAAGVVDHVKPHKGDLDLFLDERNLQSLCKPCHDSHKQAQEHNTDGLLRGAGHDGRPLDLAHPWHQSGSRGGGVEISEPRPLKTAQEVSFAKPQNG